jgi:hypothetical protein
MPADTALLQTVPQPISDWFWSDDLTDRVAVLKKKFGIRGAKARVIPDLLFRLETKQLAWEDFKPTLIKELGILPLKADEIMDEIKLSLLMPIARDLAAFGIGTKEFAVIGNAPPPPSFVGPTQPTTKLPPFFTAPTAKPPAFQARPAAPPPAPPSAAVPQPPISSIPPAPAPVRSSQTGPAPVILRHEPSTSASVSPGFDIRSNISRLGDQLKHIDMPLPPPPHAARVELGTAAIWDDGAPKPTVRVQKETAPSRPADYSFDAHQFISGSNEISFGPDLGALNATPAPGANAIPQPAPAIPESIELPQPPPAIAEPVEASGGVMDRLMQKIAPWHYARFSKGAARATGALESAEPSKVVNYVDTDVAAPQPPATTASQAGGLPLPTPVPTPLDTSFSDPPKPLS